MNIRNIFLRHDTISANPIIVQSNTKQLCLFFKIIVVDEPVIATPQHMQRRSAQKEIETQLKLQFLAFPADDAEGQEEENGVFSVSNDESEAGSIQIDRGSTETTEIQSGKIQKNEDKQRVNNLFKSLKVKKKVKKKCPPPPMHTRITKQQVNQVVNCLKTQKNPINQAVLKDIAAKCNVPAYIAKKIKQKWTVDPSLTDLLKEFQKKPSEELIRTVRNHIQSIMRYEQRIKVEDLLQRVRQRVPEGLRDQVSQDAISFALQAPDNALSSFSVSGRKVCLKTGFVKKVLDVGEYCKNLLGLLDSSKIVYFVNMEMLAGERSRDERDEQNAVLHPALLFRGVLGSNLQSFCDIFLANEDSVSKNNSFIFLLKVLALKSAPSQKYLFMPKHFMEQYGPSLRYASEAGFTIGQLAAPLKAFSPLSYWLHDLRLLARKYSVRTRGELRQILQYEATRFDKQVYADYFRTARRKMRRALSNQSQNRLSLGVEQSAGGEYSAIDCV